MDYSLTKIDLCNMVFGLEPDTECFEELSKKELGSFNGSYSTWAWNKRNVWKLEPSEIVSLYLKSQKHKPYWAE